jgi:uncharacterized membrane protein
MGNNYFDPAGLYVEPGTTVRFELVAGAHSATAYPDRIPPAAEPFDSGVISQGSFEYTFEAPGTYDYYCIPHKSVGMVGRIVVGSPGGPAAESPNPDGDVPDSETIVGRGTVAQGGGSGGNRDGGAMGPGMGPGGMHGRGGGWFGALPFVGGALGVLGVAGGALYWALSREGSDRGRDDAALATLRERYANGEIDEEEFRRRRDRLTSEEDRSS